MTHDYSCSVLRLVYGDIIGEVGETVIETGSVVTKDVEAYLIVVGNPVIFIKYRFNPEEVKIYEKALFSIG